MTKAKTSDHLVLATVIAFSIHLRFAALVVSLRLSRQKRATAFTTA